jgi:hypothetical protein
MKKSLLTMGLAVLMLVFTNPAQCQQQTQDTAQLFITDLSTNVSQVLPTFRQQQSCSVHVEGQPALRGVFQSRMSPR